MVQVDCCLFPTQTYQNPYSTDIIDLLDTTPFLFMSDYALTHDMNQFEITNVVGMCVSDRGQSSGGGNYYTLTIFPSHVMLQTALVGPDGTTYQFPATGDSCTYLKRIMTQINTMFAGGNGPFTDAHYNILPLKITTFQRTGVSGWQNRTMNSFELVAPHVVWIPKSTPFQATANMKLRITCAFLHIRNWKRTAFNAGYIYRCIANSNDVQFATAHIGHTVAATLDYPEFVIDDDASAVVAEHYNEVETTLDASHNAVILTCFHILNSSALISYS